MDPAKDRLDAARRYVNQGTEAGSAVYFAYGWGHRGCTGLACSVRHLFSFARALEDGTLLGEAGKIPAARPGPGGYGYGWYATRMDAETLKVCHQGTTVGFHAALYRFAVHDLVLAVACNSTQSHGLVYREAPGVVMKSLFDLSPHPGLYGEEGAGFRVERKEGTLRVQALGADASMRLWFKDLFQASRLQRGVCAEKGALRAVALLAGAEPEALRALLREDVDPSKVEAWRDLWKAKTGASGKGDRTFRVGGMLWEYGKLWVEVRSDARKEPGLVRVLWDPYKDRLVDVAAAGPGRLGFVDLTPLSRSVFSGYFMNHRTESVVRFHPSVDGKGLTGMTFQPGSPAEKYFGRR
jgi:hypothetical protein